jgi:hypothetical protein
MQASTQVSRVAVDPLLALAPGADHEYAITAGSTEGRLVEVTA